MVWGVCLCAPSSQLHHYDGSGIREFMCPISNQLRYCLQHISEALLPESAPLYCHNKLFIEKLLIHMSQIAFNGQTCELPHLNFWKRVAPTPSKFYVTH